MNGCMALEDLLHPWLGKYLGAPGWLKASAGRAYACLPQRVRLGGAYQRFRADLAESPQGHDAADRLGAALEWALTTVPAYEGYRHVLAAARDPLEALAQLPVTDKLDIKRHPERYLSTGMPASARLEMYTGGSTRNPMRFFLQKHVTRAKEFAYVQDFRARIGMDASDTVLALRGRTVPTAAQPGGRIWMYEPIKRQLILSSDHLERRYMPAYAEALAVHRPTYIEAFPSALYPLARWLAANPVPEFTRGVKGVMLYSENVYGYQLDKFREVFNSPVVSHYGHSERVLMAASMPDDDRYFFWPRYGHFELLDAENRPVTQPGKLGFIVGTSFDNRVMPFLRYRTGDLGVLSERAMRVSAAGSSAASAATLSTTWPGRSCSYWIASTIASSGKCATPSVVIDTRRWSRQTMNSCSRPTMRSHAGKPASRASPRSERTPRSPVR